MANRWGISGNGDIVFSWTTKSLWTVTAAMKLKDLLLGRKAVTSLGSILKSRNTTLLTKVCIVKSMVFPVVMYGYELDHKEGQAPKNWCFQRVSWKRLFRLYWTLRRSNLSVLKVNNPEYSLEGLMLKLKLEDFGHLVKSWLTGKDSDAGRDWGQEEKGTTEDEMAGWHHWLNGHDSE